MNVSKDGPPTMEEARLRCCKFMPYLTPHVMSLPMFKSSGVPTMAVDQWGRLYWNPEFLAGLELDEAAWVVAHEDAHVWMRHAERCKKHLGDSPSQWQLRIWNIAADCSINQILRETWKGMGKRKGLPDGGCYPEGFGLPLNKTTEYYYDKLVAKAEEYSGGTQGAGGGENGSGADGQQREWEEGPPQSETGGEPGDENGTSKEIGLSKHEQGRLERVLAQSIDEYDKAKGRGSVAGGWRRYADRILKPRIDPRRDFLASVKTGLARTKGYQHQTYARPNRRTETSGSMRMPTLYDLHPSMVLIIDTSGSMGGTDLGLSLGVIQSTCKALPRENLRVITGDTHAAHCQKCFSAEQVELHGGGGTDMGKIVEEAAALNPKPDLIVVLTDGDTPWCENVGVKTIACITRPGNEWNKPPAWIKTIHIDPKCSEGV